MRWISFYFSGGIVLSILCVLCTLFAEPRNKNGKTRALEDLRKFHPVPNSGFLSGPESSVHTCGGNSVDRIEPQVSTISPVM